VTEVWEATNPSNPFSEDWAVPSVSKIYLGLLKGIN